MKWKKFVNPPAAGWYPTKSPPLYEDNNACRWWDGTVWSWAAFPHESAANAAKWAEKKEAPNVSSFMAWREM